MTNIELIKVLLDDVKKYGSNREVLLSDVESLNTPDIPVRNTVSNKDGFFIEFKY